MWVLDYLNDLESDLSAFHRVDDMFELDGPRFFRLAVRCSAYDGVMRARVANLSQGTETPVAGNPQQDAVVVSFDQFRAQHADLIE